MSYWLSGLTRAASISGSSLTRRVSSRMSRNIGRQLREFVGKGPMVSFTFDDAPLSAASNGAPMLEAIGARGTFYVATGLLGRKTEHFTIFDEDVVRALHRTGHEIALHSDAHLAAHQHSRASFEADLATNRARLATIDPTIEANHFAYPYGAMSVSAKRILGRTVMSSRGITSGLNFGRFDAQHILAVELSSQRLTPRELDIYLEKADKNCAWLVFFSHDISKTPSEFGCSIDLFSRAVYGAAARGLRFTTISEAFAQTRAITPLRAHSFC